MNLRQLLLSPGGRIGRKSFWIGLIAIFVISFVTSLVLTIGVSIIRGQGTGSAAIVTPLVQLALIYPSICITTKRLHDLGRSGWWQAPVYALWIGGVAFVTIGVSGLGGLLMMVAVLGGLAMSVFTGFVAGAAQPNRFGAPEGAGDKTADLFA
ncbi:DUF805 domain-containing protein [Phenylobacterium sp.]|jgi:uncharacterized membrane protein YhaH (DUF805 family)|uniref:DUF805 domain-containing protein n=1 Tax=Phenylobacterium sp. TaxID=1871053 RepID=UPI002E318252|nr:DUF805 domain-containing protein [Phenylobacterium sp.]HEX2561857.1 DUF805 domain-containing protein [Phenylobacterium sp.]